MRKSGIIYISLLSFLENRPLTIAPPEVVVRSVSAILEVKGTPPPPGLLIWAFRTEFKEKSPIWEAFNISQFFLATRQRYWPVNDVWEALRPILAELVHIWWGGVSCRKLGINLATLRSVYLQPPSPPVIVCRSSHSRGVSELVSMDIAFLTFANF